MQKFVNWSFLSASKAARITAKKLVIFRVEDFFLTFVLEEITTP